MSKYQFKVNGEVVTAKELYELGLVDHIDNVYNAESVLGGLLQGKVVELYHFFPDDSVGRLQLVEVKNDNKEALEILVKQTTDNLIKNQKELLKLYGVSIKEYEAIKKQIKELENE